MKTSFKNAIKNYYEYDLQYLGEEFTHNLNITDLQTNDTDFLHTIFIKLNIPAIYSSIERQFKWNKYLGLNMLQEISCSINFNNSIENISLYTYSEWMFIWHEINLDGQEKQNYYNSIGHIKELYEPENSFNRNGMYPVSHVKKQTYKWKLNDNNIKQATSQPLVNDYNYNKPPSISSKTLYIPLNFSFCNLIDDSLPLEVIKSITIKVKTRPPEDLYTVLLVPEDFVLNHNNDNVTSSNTNNTVIIPSTINFINNTIPVFSSNIHYVEDTSDTSNISIFDVLMNNYRIKPVINTLTSINHFMSNNNDIELSNIEGSIIKKDFYELYGKISIIYNVLTIPKIEVPKFKLTGIFKNIEETNILDKLAINEISLDNTVVLSNAGNYQSVKNIFWIARHNSRKNKNDLFNFTNLDYNLNYSWEKQLHETNNNIFNSSMIFNSGSIWEQINDTNTVKFQTNFDGEFQIKKYILENGTHKYQNVLTYSSPSVNNIVENIWNYKSHLTNNFNILSSFKIKLNNDYVLTNKEQDYDFYNRITVLQDYKNTVPGLYYINNSYKNVFSLKLVECNANKIKIDESDGYTSLTFLVEEKVFNLQTPKK